jgi:UPF0755 protein
MTRSPSSRPRTSTARKRTKKRSPAVLVLVTIVLMAASFSCGFGALTLQADIMRPVASSAPTVTFVVNAGDSATSVIDRLAQQKLIRNATVVKYYLKVTGANFKPATGSHQISASMTPDQIIHILSTPIPHIVVNIRVDDGSRLTEYADQIVKTATDPNLNKTPTPLSNFSKQDFLNMVVNGNNLDQFTKSYWFLKPWTTPPAYAALEGYLYPNTYQVYSDDSTATIIGKMLQAFGNELCPGADLSKVDDCKAHQKTITMPSNSSTATVPGAGKTMKVFDALDKYYGANGTDYAGALQKALIIGSIAEHEARSSQHRALVASTYYNDWKDLTADSHGYLAADPTEQYYLASQPGYTGDPWAPLAKSPAQLPTNPYNTYSGKTKGLPPSAISAPTETALYGAIFPPTTTFHFFFFACDNNNYYADTFAQIQALEAQHHINNGNC